MVKKQEHTDIRVRKKCAI